MNKIKPWLLLALVFAAGFAGGVVVTRLTVKHFVRTAIEHPQVLRASIERRLDWRLGLDARQRVQVHQILFRTERRLRVLRRRVQPQYASILQDARADIAAVLTPEQRVRFERFLRANRPFWQRAGDGPGAESP